MIFKRLTNSEDKIYEKWVVWKGLRIKSPHPYPISDGRKKAEIDPPNDDVSVRRKAFYERAGYRANPFEHIHPPYHSEYKGHRLVVMTCPTAISENEYKNFNSYLENVVMKNNITGIFRHFQQTTTNFFVMLG